MCHRRRCGLTPTVPAHLPPREQGLISVSETEQSDPKPDAMLDPSRPASRRVEREAKAAANDRGTIVQAPQQVEPAETEPRVTVQEHEPAPPGALRPAGHLDATATR